MVAGSRNPLDLHTHCFGLTRAPRCKAQNICELATNLNPKPVWFLRECDRLDQTTDGVAHLSVIRLQRGRQLFDAAAIDVGQVGVNSIAPSLRNSPPNGIGGRPQLAVTWLSSRLGWTGFAGSFNRSRILVSVIAPMRPPSD